MCKFVGLVTFLAVTFGLGYMLGYGIGSLVNFPVAGGFIGGLLASSIITATAMRRMEA